MNINQHVGKVAYSEKSICEDAKCVRVRRTHTFILFYFLSFFLVLSFFISPPPPFKKKNIYVYIFYFFLFFFLGGGYISVVKKIGSA